VRLAVYRDGRPGKSALGLVVGDELVDVTDLVGSGPFGPAGPLQAALDQGLLAPDGALRGLDPARLAGRPHAPLSTVVLLSPLPRPGKVIGAPVNYLDHKTEMAVQTTIAELGLFLKAPSSVVGPGEPIRLPYTDLRTDQEGELAVVIGRTARDVPAERAADYVAGYACLLDITVRSGEDRSTRKSFDTFTPLGPWLTTADEVGDPGDLRLRCWVNGTLRQDTSTSALIYDVPQLIAYASSVMTLWPGDVIATGTPAGVGPIADGDLIVVEIERVGRLETPVSAATAIPYADRPGAF
jgi:2-keto-4-pentenoate hydratase/2-oxohepta-3-ene-1,7-dioic acid hydratase in catechol pathway